MTPVERLLSVSALRLADFANRRTARVRFVILPTSNDDEMRFRLLRAIESGL